MTLSELKLEQIEQIALVDIPENFKKDTDGDWIDMNANERKGYIKGMFRAIEISNKLL